MVNMMLLHSFNVFNHMYSFNVFNHMYSFNMISIQQSMDVYGEPYELAALQNIERYFYLFKKLTLDKWYFHQCT